MDAGSSAGAGKSRKKGKRLRDDFASNDEEHGSLLELSRAEPFGEFWSGGSSGGGSSRSAQSWASWTGWSTAFGSDTPQPKTRPRKKPPRPWKPILDSEDNVGSTLTPLTAPLPCAPITVEVSVLVEEKMVSGAALYLDVSVGSASLEPSAVLLTPKGECGGYREFASSIQVDRGMPLAYCYRFSPPLEHFQGLALGRMIEDTTSLPLNGLFDNITYCTEDSAPQVEESHPRRRHCTSWDYSNPSLDLSFRRQDSYQFVASKPPAQILDLKGILGVRLEMCLQALESTNAGFSRIEDFGGCLQRLLAAIDCLPLVAFGSDGEEKQIEGSNVEKEVRKWGNEFSASEQRESEDATPLRVFVILTVFGHLSLDSGAAKLYDGMIHYFPNLWRLLQQVPSEIKVKTIEGINLQVRNAMQRGHGEWMALCGHLSFSSPGWNTALQRFRCVAKTTNFQKSVRAAAEKGVSSDTLSWLLSWAPTLSCALEEATSLPVHSHHTASSIVGVLERRGTSWLSPSHCQELQAWLDTCAADEATSDCAHDFCHLMQLIDFERAPLSILASVLRVLLNICATFHDASPLSSAAEACPTMVLQWGQKDLARNQPGTNVNMQSVTERMDAAWKPLLAVATDLREFTKDENWASLGELFGLWLYDSVLGSEQRIVEACLSLLGGGKGKGRALPAMMTEAVNEQLVKAVTSAAAHSQRQISERLLGCGKLNTVQDAVSAMFRQSASSTLTAPEEMVRSLLTWPLWKQFLESPPLADCLLDDSKSEVRRMRAFKDRVELALADGSVTLAVADEMECRAQQVSDMFGEASVAALQSTLKTVAAFKTRRELLSGAVNLCQLLQPDALPELEQECAKDFKETQVKHLDAILTLSDDDRRLLHRLQVARRSEVFLRMWCEHADACGRVSTLRDAVSTCLEPVFGKVGELATILKDKTATVRSVLSTFRDCDADVTRKEVRVIAAVASDDCREASPPAWCDDCVGSIQAALVIRNCARAGSSLVRLADCLRLDLSGQESFCRLQQWHGDAAALADTTLGSMKAAPECIEVLQRLSQGQIESLEALSDSRPLLQWLQKGGSLAEFGRRIRILAGCVETPQDVARISAVDTVHARVISLLELATSTSAESSVDDQDTDKGKSSAELYESVLRAAYQLDASGDLAAKIVQCSNDLTWFQKLESDAEQGAFVDSKNRMDRVMDQGTLRFSGTDDGALLQVTLSDAPAASKPLSLQDLVDLRARVSLLLSPDDDKNSATLLCLGRLTKAAGRCVRALEGLITDGSLAHQAFAQECRSVEETEELCGQMEESLKSWTAFVREQRARHWEINRFTMKQLGVIASSTLFDFGPESSADSSVSSDTLHDDVTELMRFANAEISKSELLSQRRSISARSRQEWLASDTWVNEVEKLLQSLVNNKTRPSTKLQPTHTPQSAHAVSIVVMGEGQTTEDVMAAVTRKFVSPRNVFLCSSHVVLEPLLLFVRRALTPPQIALISRMQSDADPDDDTAESSCEPRTFFLLAGIHKLDPATQTALSDEIQTMLKDTKTRSQLVATCDAACRINRLATHPFVREDAKTPWSEHDGAKAFPSANVAIFSGPAQSGKSFQIRSFVPAHAALTTLVVHSGCPSSLCEALREAAGNARSSGFAGPIAFHVEISPTFTGDLDVVAFGLIVAGFFQSSSGRVWYRRATDLILIELPGDATTRSLTSTVIQQHGVRPRPKTPSQLVEHVGRLEADGRRATTQHKAIIGRDAESGCQHLDPDVWASQRFQEASQLLHFADLSVIDEHDPVLSLGGVDGVPGFSSEIAGLPAHVCLKVVVGHMRKLGLNTDSWGAFDIFWRFVAHQARSFVSSVFLSTALADDLPGFRLFVIQRLLALCQDFATNVRELGSQESPDQLQVFNAGRRWAHQQFSYVIAHHSHISFFNLQVAQRGEKATRPGIVSLSEELHSALRSNAADLYPDYARRSRSQLLQDLSGVLGMPSTDDIQDPDPHYHLSVDSIKKMMATWLRLQAGIPVIIQGETGCGKTSLMEFLAKVVGVQARVCRVHGGTSKTDVERAVSDAEALSRKRVTDRRQGCLLFFDEINCGPDMGCFKELLCDRRLDGRRLDDGVLLVAACNPYRRLAEAVVQRQEAMGLGFRSADQEELLGIPLRHLVYRVHPLPASLLEFVWDFGELAPEPERAYVEATLRAHAGLDPHSHTGGHFANAIVTAHSFLRRLAAQGEEFGGAVSVRDYKERAIPVYVFFVDLFRRTEVLNDIDALKSDADRDTSLIHQWTPELNAMFVALYVAYEARLTTKDLRNRFRREVARDLYMLTEEESAGSTAAEMAKSVEELQALLTQELPLSKGIAMNEVLRENLFLMAVCAQLSIPLFVVGKPGTSKSLAKTIISDAMKGARSPSRLFRHFKHLTLFSYQCSPHSTSEDVQRVFARAEQFLQGKDSSAFASVVVLDEVGLAENSPRMPLKVLHPLLEKPTVAFFGLSNWAIDPAKMNRCVALARFDPDCDDLMRTLRGISLEQPKLAPLLQPACKAYLELQARHQPKENFYGLRDFFSLVRMLGDVSSMQDPAGVTVTKTELESCVRTCFGGSAQTERIVACFLSHMASVVTTRLASGQEERAPTTPLEIITARLGPARPTGRFLLIQTENADAALQTMLEKRLLDADKLQVLSGSKFPLDQGLDDMCAQLRTVRMCMAAERTLVCCELEHCLEALYDLLNQFYTVSLGKKWVDVGLGNDRMQCEVGDGFRILIFASEAQVSSFPIPLLNRLEKHALKTIDFLSPRQTRTLHKLESEIQRMTTPALIGSKTLVSMGGLLPGLCEDTLPSLVATFCVDQETSPVDAEADDADSEKLALLQDAVLWASCPEAVISGSMSPRVASSYFEAQEHYGLAPYLARLSEMQAGRGMRGVVTTFSTSLSQIEKEVAQFTATRDAEQGLMTVSVRSLDDFQRMADLDSFLVEQRMCLAKSDGSGHRMAVLHATVARHQADLAHQVLNIVMLQLRPTAHSQHFHVVILLHLQRDSSCNAGLALRFDREWHRAHLDVVSSSGARGVTWQAWQHVSPHCLFERGDADNGAVIDFAKVIDRIVPEALSRLSCDDAGFQPLACVRAVRRLLLNDDEAATVAKARILALVRESTDRGGWNDRSWIVRTAGDRQALRLCGSLERALLGQAERVVSLQMSTFLRGIACDGGLDMVNDISSADTDSAEEVKRRIWTEIVRFPAHGTPMLIMQPMAMSDSNVSVRVRAHGKTGTTFYARFPLSFAVYERLETLKQSMVAPLSNLVAHSAFFQTLDTLGPADLAIDYLHDLSRFAYRPASKTSQEDEHHVVTALLIAQVTSLIDSRQASASQVLVKAHTHIASLSFMLSNLQNVFTALPTAAASVRKWVDEDKRSQSLTASRLACQLLHTIRRETGPKSELFSSRAASAWADRVKELTEVAQNLMTVARMAVDEQQGWQDAWAQRVMGAMFVDTVHVDGQSPTVAEFWEEVVAGSTMSGEAELSRLINFWGRWKDNARFENLFLRAVQTLYADEPRQDAVNSLVTQILMGDNCLVVPRFAPKVVNEEDGQGSATKTIGLSQAATTLLVRPVIASCLSPGGVAVQNSMQTLDRIVGANQVHDRAMVDRMVVTVAEELLSAASDSHLLAAYSQKSEDAGEAGKLLAVAGLRVMLSRAAACLAAAAPEPAGPVSTAALALCMSKGTIESAALGRQCQSFVLRQVVKNYGVSTVRRLASDKRCPWVGSYVSQQPNAARVNAFALHGESFEQALTFINGPQRVCQPFSLAMYSLAVAHSIAMDLSSPDSKAKSSRVIDIGVRIGEVCRSSKVAKLLLQTMAKNQLGGLETGVHRAVLAVSSQQSDEQVLVQSFIVHAALAALSSKEEDDPLKTLLQDPIRNFHCHGPALIEAENLNGSLGDEWLLCDNGHPVYFAGDSHTPSCVCGGVARPRAGDGRQQSSCSDFIVHDLLSQVRRRDRGQKPAELSAVRNLTASAVGVIRAICHALLLASCALRGVHDDGSPDESLSEGGGGEDGVSDASLVATLGIRMESKQTARQALLQFLAQVLINDVAALAQSLHMSNEDTLLILHAMCRRQIEHQRETSNQGCLDNAWRSRMSRNKWEDGFNRSVVGPVLCDFRGILERGRVAVGMIGKREKLAQALRSDVTDVLWGDRCAMSVEFCHRHLEETNTSVLEFQCLRQVLKNRSKLRLLAALPRLLGMQTALKEQFAGRLSLEEARNTAIKSVLSSMQDDPRLRSGFDALVSTWDAIKDSIETLVPVAIASALKAALPETFVAVTEETSLSYLLPSFVSEGLLGITLVVALCEIQNRFLNAVQESAWTQFKVAVADGKLSLPDAGNRQLAVVNESALTDILYSCSEYAINSAGSDEVSIDFIALESKVVAEFIEGRRYLASHTVCTCPFSDQDSIASILSNLRSSGLNAEIDEADWVAVLEHLLSRDALKQAHSTSETLIRCLARSASLPTNQIGIIVRDVLLIQHDAMGDPTCPAFDLHPSCALSLWRRLDMHLALQRLQSQDESASEADALDMTQELLPSEVKAELVSALRRVDAGSLLAEVRELVLTQHQTQPISFRRMLQVNIDKKGKSVLGFQESSFPESVMSTHLHHVWVVMALAHIEAGTKLQPERAPMRMTRRAAASSTRSEIDHTDARPPVFSYPEVLCVAGQALAGISPVEEVRMDSQPQGQRTFSVRPQLPAGLECDSATGAIFGCASCAVPRGIYIVSCRTLRGLSRSELVLTVRLPPPVEFRYTSTSTLELDIGAEMPAPLLPQIQSPSSMPDGVRYSAQALPAGLELCSRSGGISGKLLSDCDCQVIVTARVRVDTTVATLQIRSRLSVPAQFKYPKTTCCKGRRMTCHPLPLDAGPLSGAGIRFEAAKPLPSGLKLDEKTGVVTGAWDGTGLAKVPSTVSVPVTAANESGSRRCKLVLHVKPVVDALASLREEVKRVIMSSSSGKIDIAIPLRRNEVVSCESSLEIGNGLVVTAVTDNPAAMPGGLLYERFLAALDVVEDKAVAIAFHGTRADNIKSIFENGLDPKRRNGQQHGRGEYFGTDIGISVSYCRGSNEMMVFALLVDKSGLTCRNGDGILVVHKSEHQLPLMSFSFRYKQPGEDD